MPILNGTQYLSGSLEFKASISSSFVISSGGGISEWWQRLIKTLDLSSVLIILIQIPIIFNVLEYT